MDSSNSNNRFLTLPTSCTLSDSTKFESDLGPKCLQKLSCNDNGILEVIWLR